MNSSNINDDATVEFKMWNFRLFEGFFANKTELEQFFSDPSSRLFYYYIDLFKIFSIS